MDSDDSRSIESEPKPKDPYRVRRFFLGWLIALNKGITKLLKKALGVNYMVVTEDEVLDMVNALAKTPDSGGDENVIEEASAKMINNIFELGDRSVADVMTHRTSIAGVDVNIGLDDLIYLALEKGFSRIPVYEESIDRITGIVIVKDLLCLIGKSAEELADFSVRDFIREVDFIPEARSCMDTFETLTRDRSGMAVVADEYGGTAGIVTLEDIIEAVMGNIQDEYDRERAEITKIGEEQYDVDGEADPEEVLGLFGIKLPEEHEYETIAGLVTEKLGYIPEAGDVPPAVEYEGALLAVLNVEDRCIKKIRVSRAPAPPDSAREE